MGKQKDEVWKLFQQNSDKSVNCKYCDKKYNFANVNKMKNHIQTCIKLPSSAKAHMSLTSKSDHVSPTAAPTVLKQKNILSNFVDSMNKEENVRKYLLKNENKCN